MYNNFLQVDNQLERNPGFEQILLQCQMVQIFEKKMNDYVHINVKVNFLLSIASKFDN